MTYSIDAPSDEDLRSLAKKIVGKAKSQEYKVYMNQPRETRDGALDARDNIYGSTKHDWIIEAFEEFLTPSPWDFEDKLSKIRQLAGNFDIGVKSDDLTDSKLLGLFDTVKSNIAGGWHGGLADAFVDDYLGPMSTYVPQNQGRCLLVLHDGLQAMCEIYSEARRNLKDLGDNAITALEAADGTGANNIKSMLTVLNTIISMGMAILSAVNPAAGGAVGITSVIISAGMAEVDKKVEDPEEVDSELGSLYPDEVMDNIKTVIDKQRTELTEAEDKLIKTLNKGAFDILQMATNGLFMVDMLMDEVELPHQFLPKGSLITPMIPELATADSQEIEDGMFQTDDA